MFNELVKYLLSEEGMTRRDFLKRLGGAAIGAAVPGVLYTALQGSHGAGETMDTKESPKSTPAIPKPADFMSELYAYVKRHEGLKLMPYQDTPTSMAIGIGHRILPGENFSKGITEQQAYELFKKDIQRTINLARSMFINFDGYPNYLKIALIDGAFRGEHKKKYKTTQLINSDRWKEAADEYLRTPDYNGPNARLGVKKRMEENRAHFLKYGTQLAQNVRTESLQQDKVKLAKHKHNFFKSKKPTSVARFQTKPESKAVNFTSIAS